MSGVGADLGVDGQVAGAGRCGWTMTVVANLCLGVIGLLPFFLLSVYVSNLGRTGGAPLGWTLVVVPLTVGFGALWFLVNRGLRSLTAPAHARSHWWLAILLTSAPTLSLPMGALVSGAF
ncbi:hypothetical protein [Streptomyces albidoflavus]|uniref:hypothetical protein n=1 Tax=Streptomyces albidoflavus TaxID=1886 RepID=UPI001F5E06E7|nr:hypothetical protein [Streptomyces albidoflavus]